MFFIMILVEATIFLLIHPEKLIRSNTKYRLNDLIAGVTSGAYQQISLVLFEVLGFAFDVAVYIYVYENFRLWTVDPKEYIYTTYFCLMFGKDLGYYVYHRFLHEYHIGWFGHSVHHSGEDYNLGTALRQGAWQPFFGPFFYTWMALLVQSAFSYLV